jgi:hypothetical protein
MVARLRGRELRGRGQTLEDVAVEEDLLEVVRAAPA